MPDWTITLSRTVVVNGAPKVLQVEHTVESMSRTLAVLTGIKHLLYEAKELVPDAARDYWARASQGSLQPYEVQSELENNWGLTFGIAEVGSVAPTSGGDRGNPPGPHPAARLNGNGSDTPTSALPDLNTMLQNHLKMLQARNAVLGDELQRKQAEFDRNNNDIMRISAMMTQTHFVAEVNTTIPPLKPGEVTFVPAGTLSIPPKRRGRPPKKENNHVSG